MWRWREGAWTVVCGVLLLTGAASAGEPPLPEEGAADEVLAAVGKGDGEPLRRIASGTRPDPWHVADVLAARGEGAAAGRLAHAVDRPDIRALPGYLATRTGAAADPPARAQLRVAEQAFRAGRHREALQAIESLPATEDIFLQTWGEYLRGNSLAQVGQAEEGRAALLAAAEKAGQLGWLRIQSWALDQAGGLSFRLGEFAQALEAHERSLAVDRERDVPSDLGTALGNLGLMYRSVGRITESTARFEEALALFTRLGDRTGAAMTKEHLAINEYQLQRLAHATTRMEEALAEYEALGERMAAARARSVLGEIESALGNPRRALSLFDAALPAFREAGDPVALAQALAGHGAALRRSGDPRAAVETFEEALGLLRSARTPMVEAALLGRLGDALSDLGDFRKAAERLEAAVRIYERIGDRANAAAALSNLADSLVGAGDPDAALPRFREALEAGERLGLRQVIVHASAGVAHLLAKRGDVVDALPYARRAVAEAPLLVEGHGEGRGAVARARVARPLNVGIAVARATGDADEITHFVEAGRAGALLEALGGRDELLAASLSPSLQQADREARAAEAAARAEFARAQVGGDRPKVRRAKQALRNAEDARLAFLERLQREASAAASVVHPRLATAAEIRASLPEGDAFIAYVLLPEEAFALVSTREATRVVRLGSPRTLASACGAFQPWIREADPAAAQAALGRLVVTPLALPEGVRRVRISPDGPLALLPWGMLLEGRDVVLVPSGSTMLWLGAHGAARGKGVLALGDPAYPDAPSAAVGALVKRGGFRLERLPATRREATEVGDVTLLGEDATEEGLVRALASRERWRAVHLACHGLVDPEDPMLSGIALVPTAEDDGLFGPKDLFRTPVRADLVVLSACETGRGKVARGEGHVGLARSFMVAGAPRVIASLWKVDDEATRALMTKFYELRGESMGLPTAEALRRAQAFVRAEDRWGHPSYWGAWVLWGLPE